MRDLARTVVEVRAEAGFGFDGDADRIGVVDNEGEIVGGDILMALFWREILPKHPGATAIIEVKCSKALEEEVRRLGGRPGHFLPVGVGGQQEGLIGVQADAVFPFDGIVGSERLRFRRQRISHGGFPLIQSARRWSGRGRPAPRPVQWR